MLILEQVLEERSDPIGAGDGSRTAFPERGRPHPAIDSRTDAEAKPVEPRVPVEVAVAVVTTSSLQQHPSVARNRETPVLLGDRQHAGLHDDQFMHREHPVRVPSHQSRRVHSRLDDRRRH